MKKILLILVLLVTNIILGQSNTEKSSKKLKNVVPTNQLVNAATTAGKTEIRQLLTTFMDCITKKDSVTFYSLFHEQPVTWVGVYRDKTSEAIVKKDSTAKTYFKDTYQEFFRYILSTQQTEEKFYNVDIVEDGSIASVTFDYSFWENNKKTNWGKESWGLVKINGQWKITSVLFSLDLEDINPEPKKK